MIRWVRALMAYLIDSLFEGAELSYVDGAGTPYDSLYLSHPFLLPPLHISLRAIIPYYRLHTDSFFNIIKLIWQRGKFDYSSMDCFWIRICKANSSFKIINLDKYYCYLKVFWHVYLLITIVSTIRFNIVINCSITK